MKRIDRVVLTMIVVVIGLLIGLQLVRIPKESNGISYEILFDHSIKKELILEVSEEEWIRFIDESFKYYKKYQNFRYDGYFMADLKYHDELGNEILIDEIGVKSKGNLSRSQPVVTVDHNGNPHYFDVLPYHFKFKFNETFDLPKDSIRYDVINNRKVFGVSEINMKWNRNYDPTYISELYSFHLMNEAGVDAPLGTVATFQLKIADHIYPKQVVNLFEVVDEDFLNHHLNVNKEIGNLYKSLWQHYGPANLNWPTDLKAFGIKDSENNYRPTYDLKTNKKDADFSDLQELMKNLKNYDHAEFKYFIEEQMDVDQFIKYLAMGVLINNPDDFRSNGNNYYLYFGDVIHLIPYDYDHSLGQGWDGAPAFKDYGIHASVINYPQVLSEGSILIKRILDDPEYQLKYQKYITEFTDPMNGVFNYKNFLNYYQEVYNDYYKEANASGLAMNLRNSQYYFIERIKSVRAELGVD